MGERQALHDILQSTQQCMQPPLANCQLVQAFSLRSFDSTWPLLLAAFACVSMTRWQHAHAVATGTPAVQQSNSCWVSIEAHFILVPGGVFEHESHIVYCSGDD